MMNTQKLASLVLVVIFSLACQFLLPARTGTVIDNCDEIISAVGEIQSGDLPDYLLETGVKRGGEFDTNVYFDVLTHLSMRDGYALDYVYQSDELGGYPLLYVHPVEYAAYTSSADIPANTELPDFHEYVQIDDTEQGYFEYAVLDIMADQFYLYWHANYNDYEIVCNRDELNDLVTRLRSGDFGIQMTPVQQARARAVRDIEPTVSLAGDVATVQFITLTKWGGFYRETYRISREFPHQIIDIKQDNLVPYDCGVAF